ncbi:2-nitroimidazole nitrohydrolase [Pseudonocardia spinosispora]|uniref:2-nitroimidazole nitrohydrolase n=1 Tax=Pseudonocardia spinosispora TaxID=103441 RepID=UPI000A0515E5|nr:2-nitroimidazole nitrohydrolase [Pseudonocardia spinosispora]
MSTTHDLTGTRNYQDWRLKDIPHYREGMTPYEFIRATHELDYRTYQAEAVAGRTFGFNGIGRLTEVALHMPNKYTLHDRSPQYQENPDFFKNLMGVPDRGPVDLAAFQRETEELAVAFEDNGITVHWVDFPEEPANPYGPLMGHVFLSWGSVWRGGTVISRFGFLPGMVGVTEYLAKWAWNNLGIPPLVAITEGAMEPGACNMIADDVLVTCLSASYDQRGTDQFVNAISKTSGTEEFHNLQLRPAAEGFFNQATGASAHPDININALDVGKLIVSPAALDYEARAWLYDNNFELIEADPDEQREFRAPCNVLLLEPGKVIAHADCVKTNQKIRDAGVEVIEVTGTEIRKACGGIKCRVMQINREPGPALADVRSREWR